MKGGRFALADSCDSSKGAGKNGRSFLDRYVTTGEHEGAYSGSFQGKPLQLSVPDAFVAGQHDPAETANFLKPFFVRGAARKMRGGALYDCAGFA